MSKSFKTAVECRSDGYYKMESTKEFFGFSKEQDLKQIEILASEVQNFVGTVNQQVVDQNKMTYMGLYCSWKAEVDGSEFSRTFALTEEGDLLGVETYEDYSELTNFISSLDA